MTSEAVVQAIENMAQHRHRFEAFCRSLSEEELARPVPAGHWTVKDYIIHLASFDAEINRWIDGVLAGRPDTPSLNPGGTPFDVDAWNEEQVSKRRQWRLDEILAEARQLRASLEAQLRLLEDSHIDAVFHFPGDNKRDPADLPYRLFLNGLARHDPIHVADMIKALPERAQDPELKAWLDDTVVRWYQATMAGPPKR